MAAAVPKLMLNQGSPNSAPASQNELVWQQTSSGWQRSPRKPCKGRSGDNGIADLNEDEATCNNSRTVAESKPDVVVGGNNRIIVASREQPVASGTLLFKPRLRPVEKPGDQKLMPPSQLAVRSVGTDVQKKDHAQAAYQITMSPPIEGNKENDENDQNEPEDEGSCGIPTTSTVPVQTPTCRNLSPVWDFGCNEAEVQTEAAQLVDAEVQTDAADTAAPLSAPDAKLKPGAVGMIPKLNLGSVGLGGIFGKKEISQFPGSAGASNMGDDEAGGHHAAGTDGASTMSVASSEDVFETKKETLPTPKEHDPTVVPVVAPTVVFDENVRLRKLCIDQKNDFTRELAQLKASADSEVLSVFEENERLKQELVANKAMCDDLKRESNELNVAALHEVAALHKELELLKDHVKQLQEASHPAAFVKVQKTENAKLQEDLKAERVRSAELGAALTFERVCNVEMRIEANLATDRYEKLETDLSRAIAAKSAIELDMLEVTAQYEDLVNTNKASTGRIFGKSGSKLS